MCKILINISVAGSPVSTAGSLAGHTGRGRGRHQCGTLVPADNLTACQGNRNYRRADPGWSHCWMGAWILERETVQEYSSVMLRRQNIFKVF